MNVEIKGKDKIIHKSREELIELIEQLETENSQLMNIIDSLPVNIFWMNKDGVIIGNNILHAKTFGYDSPHGAVGTSIFNLSDNSSLDPNVPHQVRQNDLRVMSTEETLYFEEEITVNNQKKVFFNAKAPLYNLYGKVTGIIGVSHDITERKHTEQALEEAKSEAELACIAKDTLIANLSHDLRTPMAGIIGISEILKNQLEDENQQALLNKVIESSNCLVKMMDDILDFSQNKLVQTLNNLPAFSLDETIQSIEKLLACELTRKNITYTYTSNPDIPQYIQCDKTKLHRVLLNLCNNAIKYTNEGGVSLSTHLVKQEKHIAYVAVTIADTGIGMSADQIKKIKQKSNAATFITDSSTLGLQFINRFLVDINGSLDITSEPNKGTTITVTFPIKALEYEPSPKPEKILLEKKHKLSRKLDRNFNVLIVEDDPLCQYITKKFLEDIGCQTTIASSIDIAKRQLFDLKREYDVIMMDISLGDDRWGGIRFTQELREEHRLELPIFAVTAHVTSNKHQECLEAGISQVITKPINKDRLFDSLNFYCQP